MAREASPDSILMCLFRSDELSVTMGDSPYPHVSFWESGIGWTNCTRSNGGVKTGYVYFYASGFQTNGDLVVAYILNNDRHRIHIMTYNAGTGDWTDAPSIHRSDLAGHESMHDAFIDGEVHVYWYA